MSLKCRALMGPQGKRSLRGICQSLALLPFIPKKGKRPQIVHPHEAKLTFKQEAKLTF